MNLSGFDLNLLKVLDALLAEGSTVRAGNRAGLSQPAVSAALSRLRHAFNDPLFVRKGRGLEPTDFARSLETPLRETLERIEDMLAGPGAFDPGTAELSFKLSGSDFFAEMLMPGLGDHVGRVAPRMRVQLVDLVPDNYIDTLERYQVDMALIPRMTFPDWVDHRVIFNSTFTTIARRGHPALAEAGIADGDPIPMDLFCTLNHVLFSPEGRLQAMGDAALHKVGRKRTVAMTLPVFSGVYRAVAGSDLIALIPTALARRVAPAAGLTCHAPPMPVDAATICIVWHRRSTNNPAHRWLREQIAALTRPLDM
ncbi:LysR family transcriptional regulator [Oceanicola sp. 22II-s10i]|uniref:LysR family transcriptional regulator n=1 Tax=Oceanicola sp. 22II-s10i TaxID=1317116 RepID=UPI000B52839D|nr:LysR family transcriptional regulator [Oceanicola sp. 22II-s10i]OWU86127.1 LysR family transcriptional regulator [Oceanicola sp. 22II-s10i]